MQTKPKANSVVTHSMQDGKIVFNVLGAGKLVFDPDKVSAENRARAMIHGFVQRISDGAARMRDKDTGKAAPPATKLEFMQRIADHLMSGSADWNLRVAAPKGVDAGLVLQAMINALSGVNSLDEAEALLAKTVKAGRAEDRDGAIKLWASSTQVAQEVKRLEIERAARANAMSSEDLLAEIMGTELGDEPSDDDGEPDEE